MQNYLTRIVMPLEESEQMDSRAFFNRKLYTMCNVPLLTKESIRIMKQNEIRVKSAVKGFQLTREEILAMRCVVDALSLIHKEIDYAREILSAIVTLECHRKDEFISKIRGECLPCYYIVNGSIDVAYGVKCVSARNIYQPHIVYTHGPGEYIGLVSLEGRTEDVAPPSYVTMKEQCTLIRIDREMFHSTIEQKKAFLHQQKMDFIKSGKSFLSHLSEETQCQIAEKMTRQEFSANKVIVRQGEIVEHLYILLSGRCECYRELKIQGSLKALLFLVNHLTEGDFFAEEGILDRSTSQCSVVASNQVTCYKIPRFAIEVFNKGTFERLLRDKRLTYPTDNQMRHHGIRHMKWLDYKQQFINSILNRSHRTQSTSVKPREYIGNRRRPAILRKKHDREGGAEMCGLKDDLKNGSKN